MISSHSKIRVRLSRAFLGLTGLEPLSGWTTQFPAAMHFSCLETAMPLWTLLEFWVAIRALPVGSTTRETSSAGMQAVTVKNMVSYSVRESCRRLTCRSVPRLEIGRASGRERVEDTG